MRASQVSLKQEVTRNDALVIMDWMENHEVTRYLNEAADIAMEINNAINRVNMMIMTHLFNRNGSFFLIRTEANEPIGFLKLIRKIDEAEMVVVIGDQKKWGQGLGKTSICQGLNIAFFQWRLQRVNAIISHQNHRSIKAFEGVGFIPEKELSGSMLYSITQKAYVSRYL